MAESCIPEWDPATIKSKADCYLGENSNSVRQNNSPRDLKTVGYVHQLQSHVLREQNPCLSEFVDEP